MDVKVFRISIITFWLSLVLGGILLFSLEGRLPLPLIEYIESTYNSELSIFDISVAIVSFIMLLLVLYSSIGLYRLKDTSRNLFTGVNVLMLLLSPLYGPIVFDPYSYVFDGISGISAGFIIAMSYMTDVLKDSANDT